MVCPFCNAEDTAVVDSRNNVDGDAIRRRRECSACSTRFTTYEKSEIDLIVKKLNKSINSNSPIYHSNLEKDWLIQKNSSIIIENKIGSITVKDQGIALENADFMDVLKVKNIKSGKIIYGFAKNQKKVVLKAKQN